MAQLKFIGVIHSVLKNLEDCPKLETEDAPEAEIEIYSEFVSGIKDIKPGSFLLLFTWLHLANRAILTTHPRNNPKSPLTGVFSTRSPDRPNPVGIHNVKVISVAKKGFIKVSGLEVLDKTPVIDIKPAL